MCFWPVVLYVHLGLPPASESRCTEDITLFPSLKNPARASVSCFLLLYENVHAQHARFFHIGNLFFSGHGSFLALSAAGHAEGPTCRLHASKFGPRPGSVALAAGVQSRAELALFAGPHLAEPEPKTRPLTP